MVKFGMLKWTKGSLPIPNFVRIAQRICHLWTNLYPKFQIFTILEAVSPYFYTDKGEIFHTRVWFAQSYENLQKKYYPFILPLWSNL